MAKNIFILSIKESFSSIRKRKGIFFLMFLVQFLFLASVFYISLAYIPKMMESAKAMSDYIANQQFDDVTLAKNILQQKDILGDDPLSITRNFNDMVHTFRVYLGWLFAAIALFLSVLWALASRLFHKSTFKELAKYFGRLLLLFSFCLGIIFVFFMVALNISLTQAALEGVKFFAKYIPLLLVSIILVYFMFISAPLLASALTLGEIKGAIKASFRIGVRKAHYILLIHIFNLMLIFGSLALIAYFVETSIAITAFFIVLFIASQVLGRIFLISLIRVLENL